MRAPRSCRGSRPDCWAARRHRRGSRPPGGPAPPTTTNSRRRSAAPARSAPASPTTSAGPAASGAPMSRLSVEGVRTGTDTLLDAGAYETLLGYATAGAVATASGALDAALRLTTEHVKSREQFGRALAEFQAVTMEVGD